MKSVFLRILSLILSALMVAFNGLSTMFPGLFPDEPVENRIAIYDAEAFMLEESEVISDYVSWLEKGGDTDKYDWKYFFTRNIAAVKVDLPDPGYSIEVDFVKENGEILEIEYRMVRAEGEFPDVECSIIILVETSKNISLINATRKTDTSETPGNSGTPDAPEKPVITQKYDYGVYSSENFKEDFIYNGAREIIKDIGKWNEYYIGSDSELDKYDEKYFEENNLIVFYIEVPDDGKTVEIASVVKHIYYNAAQVNFRVKNGESDYTKGYWAVVIETGKDISFAVMNETGIKGESVLLDAEMFRADYLPPREDGAYKIVSSYSEFNELKKDAYISEYTFTEEFFADSSLALIYVMLPNENYYAEVVSQDENGDTLEIEYSTSLGNYVLDRYEGVMYKILAAEISKEITKVNAAEKSFKNNYKAFGSDKFNDLSNGTQLVSDYETWSRMKPDSEYLGKYDEEYFENSSLVLVSETIPDSGAYFDVIKMKENGVNFEIIYGINSFGGLAVIEYKTLVVEVSKAVRTVSAERKDLKNNFSVYKDTKLYKENESRTTMLIENYTKFNLLAPEKIKASGRYDAEFFKNNSLVLVEVVLADSACTSIVRYAYEEDGTFNIGIKDYRYDSVGLDVICYETVAAEVSKDVKSVNAEIFE